MEAKDTVDPAFYGLRTSGHEVAPVFIKLNKLMIEAVEAQAEISFKAGAKAMYDLLRDDTYAHIEMKKERYPEYMTKLRRLLVEPSSRTGV